MFTAETVITLLAFFVFGLIGQVIVLSVVDATYIAENILNYLSYFGFSIGFLVFGFFYFNNIINQLKNKDLEYRKQFTEKDELIEALGDELRKCEQKVKITKQKNLKYEEKISALLHK